MLHMQAEYPAFTRKYFDVRTLSGSQSHIKQCPLLPIVWSSKLPLSKWHNIPLLHSGLSLVQVLIIGQ